MHAGAQVICRMMVSLKEESQRLTGLLSFSAQTPNVEIYSGILNNINFTTTAVPRQYRQVNMQGWGTEKHLEVCSQSQTPT